ncbi:MAG: exo-alpha-sialidase [Acidimicrobiales bacterium]
MGYLRSRPLAVRMAGGACLALLAGSGGAWAAPSPTNPVVEASRQVTVDNDPTRLFDVPTVAVHPRDPRTLVVAVGDARNGGCQLRVSHDGGLSWTTTAQNLMPKNLPYCVHRNTGSYIAPAFAPDGTLYVALSGTPAEDHPNGPMTAIVARTKDLGATFETSIVATPRSDITFTNADGRVETNLIEQHRYASIAVDPVDSNLVYRGWRFGLRGTVVENAAPRQPLVSVSSDGGRTWSKAVNVAGTLPGGEKIYAGDVPVLVVGADRTVYAFTKEIQDVAIPAAQRGKARLLMSKSTDSGKTWATSVINAGAASVTNPFAAIDRHAGSLYVTWDQREGNEAQRVLLISSSDGGKTWSEARNLPDDLPSKGIEHYNPGVSVAPNGRVDVAWFDFRNDPAFVPRTATAAPRIRYADVYMTSSTDGGRTWGPNVRVTDRAIDTSIGVTFSNYGLRGTIGIASTNAATYVVWPDSRAGRPDLESEDAYLTRVRFADDVVAAPGGEPSKAPWIAFGAAMAIAIGGVALLVGTRIARVPAPT